MLRTVEFGEHAHTIDDLLIEATFDLD